MNIRRYINNRNEVNAQCAKVAAKNKEKQYKEHKKKQAQNMYEVTTLIETPDRNINNVPVDNQNNVKQHCEPVDDEMLHDSVDGECSHLMSSIGGNDSAMSGNDSELNDNCDEPQTPTPEVDSVADYEDSILHVHSPLKSPSVPEVSCTPDTLSKEDEDTESCV